MCTEVIAMANDTYLFNTGILDTVGVNSFVAFSLMHPEWKNHSGSTRRDKRKFFLLEVGESLVDEHMRRRAQNRTIAGRPLVASAVALLGVLAAPTEPETQSTCNKKRGRCANCKRTKDHKVVTRCQNCGNFTCEIHASKTVTFTCLRCPNQSDDWSYTKWKYYAHKFSYGIELVFKTVVFHITWYRYRTLMCSQFLYMCLYFIYCAYLV